MTVQRNITLDLNKIKFNGKTCVQSFIQKVNEFVVSSRGIDYDKIFSFGFETFVDDAASLVRCVKPSIVSWSKLVPLLKADFCPHD